MDEMIQETYEENLPYFPMENRSRLAEKIRELEREAEVLSRESLRDKNDLARRQSYEVWSTAFVLRAVEATVTGDESRKREALDRALILYQAAQLPKDAGEYETES